MRKYFLEFQNPELELKYQKDVREMIQKPVMRYGTYLNIFQQSIGIILSIYNQQAQPAIKCSIILFANLSSFFLVYKTDSYYRAYFHIWNIFLIFASDDVQYIAQTSNQGYLFGITIMCLNSIALLCVDFQDAIIQIFMQVVGSSLLCMYYSNLKTFNIYIGYAIIGIIYAKILYINKKFVRDQFYLTQKDQQWNDFLPIIIHKPMFIFMFQQDQLKFTCQSHFNIDLLQDWNQNESIDRNFKQFLRSNYNLENTLENLLHKMVISKQNFANIKLRNKNQVLDIQVLDLGLQNQSNYLMVIDINNHSLDIIQNQSPLVNHFIQYSNSMHKLVNRCKKKNSLVVKIIFQATITMYNPYIKIFDCIKYIKKVANLFRCFKVQIKIQDSQMMIQTYSHKFKSFIIYLLLIVCQSKSRHVCLKFEQNQFDDIIMTIMCNHRQTIYDNLKKYKYIQYLQSELLINEIRSDLVFEFYNMRTIQ
ncbi:hypothetical protein pb186bvf_004133 [Paramecium bursaria]